MANSTFYGYAGVLDQFRWEPGNSMTQVSAATTAASFRRTTRKIGSAFGSTVIIPVDRPYVLASNRACIILGTAVYVVLAQYDMAALTTVMIDGVQANVTAQNYTLELTSDGCDTRTLFATNMTNTNHTVTVSYAGTGLGRTVLNKIMYVRYHMQRHRIFNCLFDMLTERPTFDSYDDGSDTPRADPTATRVAVTIGDTGASPTATPSASADTTSGCGNGCKATSIGGGAGLIITLIFLWCFWRCCCGSRRTHTEVHTVTVVRPPSPPPRPIIVVAATLEVQQTHIQVNRVDRNSAVASPPAYEQTNYK